MTERKCDGVSKLCHACVIEQEMTERNDVVRHRVWNARFEGSQQTMFAPLLM
jgi:hypothetical protein